MTDCTATVPRFDITGDDFYGPICNQDYIDYFWDNFGFSGNGDYWKHGFGFEDPCNSNLPLGRTFNGLYLLNYSAEDYDNESYDSPILNWAPRFVRENCDDLLSFCGDGSVVAYTDGNTIELYLDYWYSQTVPERASTLVHESRHANGYSHDALFPAGSIFGAGAEGADSSWEYQGAWMFDAFYLWSFAVAGTRTTSAMREWARQAANVIIENAFAASPGFTIAGASWETLGGKVLVDPALASWAPGRLDVFGAGADKNLWHRYFDGGWGSWHSHGMPVNSPAVVAREVGRYDIFERGADDSLQHLSYHQGTWSSWESLGGVLTSKPAACSWGSGRIDVFAKGQDNALWHKWFDGGVWSGWQSLGGVLTSAPAAASWGPGRIDVFAKGQDNALWHRWYSGGAWHGWDSHGWSFTGNPTVCSWGPGRLDVFVRGSRPVPSLSGLDPTFISGIDPSCWHRWFQNGWSEWEPMGGVLSGKSSPAAVSWQPGRIDLIGIGMDSAVWHRWFNGKWHP